MGLQSGNLPVGNVKSLHELVTAEPAIGAGYMMKDKKMFNEVTKTIEWAGRPLTIETGKIARQADGAVLVTYGETKVMATVVGQKNSPSVDFFPLTVNYQERAYAAGKIPGGFFKREGRPSEHETLVSRLIDRPIRPLFADGFSNEVQVIITTLSIDQENPSDVIALVAASAALSISGLPFQGPVGGSRVAYINGEYVINPTTAQMEESALDLIVAGTTEGVLMVESEAGELSEEIMLGAVTEGHTAFQPVIKMLEELKAEAGKPEWELAEKDPNEAIVWDILKDVAEDNFRKAYGNVDKQERTQAVATARDEAMEAVIAKADDEETAEIYGKFAGKLFKKLEAEIVRGDILKTGKRIDGRTGADIRQIKAEVGVLPRAHGSALFTRGETQALVVTTLGTGRDEQIIDALEGEYRSRFMLHYNFPPFSVGETGRVGSPGRREIGHGKLAWRAINPIMPGSDEFPYTMRVVSEITESNGSSSMATVCGTSMALMDAGAPLGNPCAGIAMGLIKEGDDYAVLSDIMGDEDHLGDMDFKVAGTENGITSLQMDLKITSITKEIMDVALNQARDGRLHILNEMASAITSGRTEVANTAPRITTFTIDREKIRDVIGQGGKVIREISETTGAKIDIEDDGTISVASVDTESGDRAVEWIKGIVAEAEEGVIYQGKVVRIVDFGAFVNFLPNKDGLVHISAITGERLETVGEVLNEGQDVWVKCLGVDDRGKVRLSMAHVNQETGEDLGLPVEEEKPRKKGGGRKK